MDQFAYDSFHKKKDRTYRVVTDRIQLKEHLWQTATTAYPLAEQINVHESVEHTALIKNHFDGIANWEKAEIPFEGLYTNNDFFSIFDFPLSQGNPEKALTLPNSIVLTKELATKIFAGQDALNQSVNVEGLGEFVVTGVLDEFPGKTHMYFEALASINYLPLQEQKGELETSLNDWGNIYDNYIYFTTKEGTDVNDLKPILKQASVDHYEAEGDFQYFFKVQSLNGITPGPLLSNNLGFHLPAMFVYVMLGLALVVLLSACFNYANLTTARAINRAKEIGVRKVVGARKLHIIGQFMIEAVVIALIAFVIADFMVQFLHPQLNNMFVSLGAPIRFDETPNLYLIFLGFAVLTGVLAGLVPSLFFAATNPLEALKKSINLGSFSKRFSIGRVNIRKVLVVIQFAFSIFFVITMVTIYQQMDMVLTTDHGFKKEGIINVKLQGMSYETIRNEFTKLSSVRNVAATTHLPALGTNNTIDAQFKADQEPIYLSYFGVDQNYVQSMELELVAGRDFPQVMPEEEQFILLNEHAVKALEMGEPEEAVGQMLTVNKKELEVIGVLKDFHYERLDEEIGSMGLRYLPEQVGSAIVTINDDRAKETIAQMEAVWKKHTNRPFEYTFYEDDMRLSYGHFEALINILGYVTIIIVSIACLGLLGMVIFHVQHKTKEIGIRKTLGAETRDILLVIGKSFLILILIAYLIGGPLAYLVNDMWLQSYAYRIDFGLPTLLIGFVMILLIVAITIGSQLYRALHINPVESLRSE